MEDLVTANLTIPKSVTGLSHIEAQRRLKQYGPNSLDLEKKPTAWHVFLSNFKNPLIVVLLIAAGISTFFGDWISAALIVTMVVVSSGLNFINSYKADKAAEELKNRVKIRASVIRDNQISKLPLEQLVKGDLVVLQAGDIVPADGQVIEANHLFVNESSLSGESFPQAKQVGEVVYMGSSITSGTGIVKVTATGHQTKFSHIAAALSNQESPTEFDREMQQFSLLIVKITVFLVLLVFLVNSLHHGNLLESLMFAVALAVGLTPEMLPMIITLNLAKGSLAMAQGGVIVKRLSAIQNFGSMDVLCTDKTGTLTENHIVLVKYVDGYGHTSKEVLTYAYLNCMLVSGVANPLDQAIRDFKTLPIDSFSKVDELPFDFERKRESVVVDHHSRRWLVAKGAPENVLSASSHYGLDRRPLTPALTKQLHHQHELLSNDGFRVLGIGIKTVVKRDHYRPQDEADLSFLGFVAFLDPPKRSVAATLKQIHDYGVTIKIITGDNELVSQRVATEINLPIGDILLGSQIERLSDNQLRLKAETANLFARVNPEQKLRIIKILQSNRHVVGYIGDGINDAPSLRAADVGISVNNAVDVAKESADLILLHKSLADLFKGVVEGRKTFANTMKYLKMSLSSNFGNVFSMAGAAVLLPFLPMLPTQILFNNLLFDSSQFAIPLDTVDSQDVLRPQKLHMKYFKRFMFTFGPISSLFDMATFGLLLWVFHFSQTQFQTGWFIESIATQVLVVYVIRTRRLPIIHSWPSWPLIVLTWLAIFIGWGVALTGLGSVFHFVSLPMAALWGVMGITLVYLLTIEGTKRVFEHWNR